MQAKKKTRRPDYQLLPDGTARAEIIHPLSKKRVYLYGTPLDVMARKADAKRLRQEIATGMVTPEQIQLRVVRIAGVVSELAVTAVWERFLDRMAAEGRARGEAGDSPTVVKARGLGEKHILPPDRLGRFSVTELSYDVMQDWLGKLARADGAGGEHDPKHERAPLRDKSISNVFVLLKTAVRALVRAKRLAGYPWGEWTVRVSKAARTVGRGRAKLRNGSELDRMLRAAERHDESIETLNRQRGKLVSLPDMRARLMVMMGLALRRGEAAGLAWDCVRERSDGSLAVEVKYQARENWARGLKPEEYAKARPQAPCKSGSEGTTTVPRGHRLVDVFREQRELLKFHGLYRPQGPVFPTPEGYFRKRDVVPCSMMRRLGKAAGIVTLGKFVQHSTRHSAATLMLDAGASINEAMKVTRHQSLSTFGGYIEEVGRNNVRLPDGFMGGGALPSGEGEPEPAPVETQLLLPVAETEESGPAPVDVDEAARVAHERSLRRRVADFAGEAFREWLAMGEPRQKGASAASLPPTVVRAAQEAARRARERAVTAGEPSSQAAARAYANTVNAWEPQRRRALARFVNQGKAAQLSLATLAEVQSWSPDERKRAGLLSFPPDAFARLGRGLS